MCTWYRYWNSVRGMRDEWVDSWRVRSISGRSAWPHEHRRHESTSSITGAWAAPDPAQLGSQAPQYFGNAFWLSADLRTKKDLRAYAVSNHPTAVQGLQTDRGTKFFAEVVQNWLRKNVWASRSDPTLRDAEDLECWQFDYNWRRPHGSLGGKMPAEFLAEKADVTPDREAVAISYDPSKEPLRFSNSKADLGGHRSANGASKRPDDQSAP